LPQVLPIIARRFNDPVPRAAHGELLAGLCELEQDVAVVGLAVELKP
jgi:hypothetical protein